MANQFDQNEHFKRVTEEGVEFVRCKCGVIIAGSVVYLNHDDQEWKDSVEEYRAKGYEIFISKEPGKYPMEECKCPPLINVMVPEGSYIFLPDEMEIVKKSISKYHAEVNRDIVIYGSQEDIFKNELQESIKERDKIHALMMKMCGG